MPRQRRIGIAKPGTAQRRGNEPRLARECDLAAEFLGRIVDRLRQPGRLVEAIGIGLRGAGLGLVRVGRLQADVSHWHERESSVPMPPACRVVDGAALHRPQAVGTDRGPGVRQCERCPPRVGRAPVRGDVARQFAPAHDDVVALVAACAQPDPPVVAAEVHPFDAEMAAIAAAVREDHVAVALDPRMVQPVVAAETAFCFVHGQRPQAPMSLSSGGEIEGAQPAPPARGVDGVVIGRHDRASIDRRGRDRDQDGNGATLHHRRNRFPDGWLEPCTAKWQLRQAFASRNALARPAARSSGVCAKLR